MTGVISLIISPTGLPVCLLPDGSFECILNEGLSLFLEVNALFAMVFYETDNKKDN